MAHNITGSKKGSGSKFKEADDTLKSTATVRTLEAISAGPIRGLVAGGKSVYLNNVPLENPDGTKNFGGRVGWDYRVGLPDQDPMIGFPSVAIPFNVGTQITTTNPVTYSVSDASVDYCNVTIGLPQGLFEHNTSKNQVNGSNVELAIYRRLGSDPWELVTQFKIDGKSAAAYEEDHKIDRPQGTGLWSIKVERITADSTSQTLVNATYLNSVTEINDVNLPYNNLAYIGIAVDAYSVGSSSIPTRSFECYGRLVKIPSNYDPIARTYSGVWDGTFKFDWTDNPAWVVYDLIADPVNGIGCDESFINKFSFYDAAVYNDELIDDGKGGTGPRFTYNYIIQTRTDAETVINDVASVMQAKVVWMGGQAWIVQDRPTSPTNLVTNSGVLNGVFEYAGSSLRDRITAVSVTWNDPNNHYQQSIVTVDKYNETGTWATFLETAQDKYGYNERRVTAVGCTNEAQARRFGRWLLYTSLQQTEICSFKMSSNGYLLQPGEIIKLYDEAYTGLAHEGRLKTGSTTTVLQLDKPVTLSTGSKVILLLNDGTYVERNITETSGTLSAITLSSALSSAPAEYTLYAISTAVEPRLFKITKMSVDDEGIITVEAISHSAGKYDFVEDGIWSSDPIFTDVPSGQISIPTNLTFKEESFNEDGAIKRSLIVSWVKPSTGYVTEYVIKWQVNSGGWSSLTTLAPTITIPVLSTGLYEVDISAIGYNNVASPSLKGTYTVTDTASGASDLLDPTDLVAVVSGDNTFEGSDLNIQWTNPIGNEDVLDSTLRDFKVEICDPITDVVNRTEYVAGVPPGQDAFFTYTYGMNLTDNANSPDRSIKIKVYGRDTSGKLTDPVIETFTNAAPAAPSGIVVSGGWEAVTLSWNKPDLIDYVGTLVWMSTTNGFTPGSGNLVRDTADNSVIINGLSDSTTYYFRIAHYDTFGKSASGTGLNLSSQLTDDTTSGPSIGVPQGPTLPGSGSEGDLFFNTTDGKLYRYHAGAWTAAVPAADISGQVTSGQIENSAITAVKISSGAVTAAKTALAAIDSSSGNLTANSVAANNIIAGAVTAIKIDAGAVSTEKLAAGAVTASKLSVIPGGENMLPNSSFEYTPTGASNRPGSWTVHNPASISITYTRPTGRVAGTVACGITCGGSTSNFIGIQTNTTVESGTSNPGGLNPGWIANSSYVLSFYAKKQNGTGFTNCYVSASSNVPTITARTNPTLTTSWQRYEFLLETGASVPSNSSLILGVNGSKVSSDQFHVDDIQLEPGDVMTGWKPRTDEILPGTILADHIAASQVTADKIATNAVTADKILANSITGGKIQAATITTDKLVAGTLEGYTVQTASSGARFVLSSSTNKMIGYDSFNQERFNLEIDRGIMNIDGISTSSKTLNLVSSANNNNLWAVDFLAYNSGTNAGTLRVRNMTGTSNGDALFVQTGSTDGFSIRAEGAGIYATQYILNNRASTGGYGSIIRRTIGSTTRNINLAGSTYCAEAATGEGKIYIQDGTGPFTGFHEGITNDFDAVEGDILIDDELVERTSISDTMFSMVRSSSAGQKGAIGVLVQIYDAEPEGFVTTADMTGYKVVHVNSVGEGQINVIGENGNIQKGDLIVCSSTIGKGMKATDDIIRSNVVARAREDVTFDNPSEVKMIACIYLCG